MLYIKLIFILLLSFSGKLFTQTIQPADITKFSAVQPIVTKWPAAGSTFSQISWFQTKKDFVFEFPGLYLGTNWTEGSFAPGDTTEIFRNISHAKNVILIYIDSTLTGTDTLWFGITNTLSNGMVIDAPVKVQNLNQTTATTYLSGAALVPGAGLTAAYNFSVSVSVQAGFTGDMKLARTNVNDNVTPFLPRGRFLLAWE